jgi:hypothetical protein
MRQRCMNLGKATFEPLLWRDGTGLHYVLRNPARGRRFRDRCWPVFQRPRRHPRLWRRRPCDVMALPCHRKVDRSIRKSAALCDARRWLPAGTLDAHQMRVEDAFLRHWRKRWP